MKRISLLLISIFILSCFGLGAQNKAETKLYDKTLKKPSVAAFDKFLKKYPKSVFADDIIARKDTLLSISPFSAEQAAEILSDFLPQGSVYKAFAQRSEAVDRIYGVCISADNLEKDHIRLTTIELQKGNWIEKHSYDRAVAETAESITSPVFIDSTSSFKIRNEQYYQFSYTVSSTLSQARYITAAAFCPQSDAYYAVNFTGKELENGKIEGRSDENTALESGSPQMNLLSSILKNNPALIHIPESDYLTDLIIEWWVEHNPNALSTANKITVNTIAEGSSLIERFQNGKGRVNSAKYTAILMDIRGYSVVVVHQKSDGQYILAWAEPECKDHYKDRLLNSISFDDSNTLRMSYYHGKKTFSYKYNLSSKSLVR